MAAHPVLSSEMVSVWLGAEEPNRSVPEERKEQEPEEQKHPWKPNPQSASFHCPLLRTWDGISGSQPNEDNHMLARAADMKLPDFETRKTTLGKHLDHANWASPSPYISFTRSAQDVQELARWRTRTRGQQTITAINPNIRVRNGLPLLNAKAEMSHYKIEDPYKGRIGDYSDHYVCLWQVTKAEIIGQWDWSEFEDNPAWYEDIVLPAYDQSEYRYQALKVVESSERLAKSLEKLSSRSNVPDVAVFGANRQSYTRSLGEADLGERRRRPPSSPWWPFRIGHGGWWAHSWVSPKAGEVIGG